MNEKPVTSILLDVGNVLFYDYPYELHYSYLLFRSLQETLEISADDFIEAAATGAGNTAHAWLRSTIERLIGPKGRELEDRAWLGTRGQWRRLSLPIPGALEALNLLAEWNRIVIMANQPPEALKVLHAFSIDRHVSHILIDSVNGYSKPDIRMFELGLQALDDASPAETLMIGDRYDNDILPALSMGLKTALIAVPVFPGRVQIEGVPIYWREVYDAILSRLPRQYVDLRNPKADYSRASLIDLARRWPWANKNRME